MGRVERERTPEIGMISGSREDDSMRCPWESEETGGLS